MGKEGSSVRVTKEEKERRPIRAVSEDEGGDQTRYAFGISSFSIRSLSKTGMMNAQAALTRSYSKW